MDQATNDLHRPLIPTNSDGMARLASVESGRGSAAGRGGASVDASTERGERGELSIEDKETLMRASEAAYTGSGGSLAADSPLLTTREIRREANCWRRNTRHLQILVVSLSTMLPLSTLSASVTQITDLYGSSTYQLVVGLLFLSAFPMALVQKNFDRDIDAKYSSRVAFSYRMIILCFFMSIAGFLYQIQSVGALLSLAFILGIFTWLSNGATVAMCSLLPSTSFIYQGTGFQAATWVGFGFVSLVHPQSMWMVLCAAPLTGLMAWVPLVRGTRVQNQLNLKDDIMRARSPTSDSTGLGLGGEHGIQEGEGIELPPEVNRLGLCLCVSMFGSIAASGLISYFTDAPKLFGLFGLENVLYLTFNSMNILSRIMVLVFEAMGFKPTLRQLEILVLVRITAGTALLYASAFVPGMNLPFIAVPALAAYGFFGGLTITWGFKIAGEISSCCDTNVEAARVCVLWQSAGLSIGASFSGAFAAGYLCVTESYQLTEVLVFAGFSLALLTWLLAVWRFVAR